MSAGRWERSNPFRQGQTAAAIAIHSARLQPRPDSALGSSTCQGLRLQYPPNRQNCMERSDKHYLHRKWDLQFSTCWYRGTMIQRWFEKIFPWRFMICIIFITSAYWSLKSTFCWRTRMTEFYLSISNCTKAINTSQLLHFSKWVRSTLLQCVFDEEPSFLL